MRQRLLPPLASLRLSIRPRRAVIYLFRYLISLPGLGGRKRKTRRRRKKEGKKEGGRGGEIKAFIHIQIYTSPHRDLETQKGKTNRTAGGFLPHPSPVANVRDALKSTCPHCSL